MNVRELEERLGYRFRDLRLLEEACTHSTFRNEHPEVGSDNERLEFVGDAVLGLLAAEILHRADPNAPEGVLSRRRAGVVCTRGLAALALALGLERFLRVGEGQARAGVASNRRLLAGVCEAVAGAVFLDGGYDAVRSTFGGRLEEAIAARGGQQEDPKNVLQERCHREGWAAPRYEVLEVMGPAHERRYRCAVSVEGERLGVGEARSKKEAERTAARRALERLANP